MSLSPLERLALCSLRPSPRTSWDVAYEPATTPPRAGPPLLGGLYLLGPDVPLRVQVGGTCAGNAVAQAIEIGHHLLREPCPPVSGTGLWAEGQLFAAPLGVDVTPEAGAWVQRVIQAASVWGWPSRIEHAEEGLQALDAGALGEIVGRARGATAIESRLIDPGFLSFLGFGPSRAELARQALREGWILVTSGLVDERFAAAQPGDTIGSCMGGGGHALCVDGYRERDGAWAVRDTWGRGIGEESLDRQRLWGDDGWLSSRWEVRAVRVVRR
jgi:hypothetical protein